MYEKYDTYDKYELSEKYELSDKRNLADKPGALLICGECYDEGEGDSCFMLSEPQAQPLNSHNK
jgi:hypothetical protein